MLTAKQEAFCQAIADGMNQSDAYRHAFDASKMKNETIQNSAYKLMQNGEVAARVKSLKDALSQKALWTREEAVNELKEIAAMGKDGKQLGAATAAIKELNAMHGYNEPVKLDVTHTGKVNVAHDVVFNVASVLPKSDDEAHGNEED